ncbi:MAG TPA: hypothetical protein GX526_01565 [Thermoanaerobacterales bacterium]|nr:hypothetical protein [Thermoanaerobacterales bacterium]
MLINITFGVKIDIVDITGGNILVIICKWCGKKKRVPKYEVKRGNGKFCSRSCAGTYHYYRKNKYIIGGKSGSDNPNWKGGITYCSKGYKMVYMPEHPYAVNCYVMAHRVAMEEAIGRFITPQEKVHHRDGNKHNNSIRNLFLFPSNSLHSKFHHAKRENPSLSEEQFMRRYLDQTS